MVQELREYRGAQRPAPNTWTAIEVMGYTPDGVLKLIQSHLELHEQHRKIQQTCTQYMERNRDLQRQIEALRSNAQLHSMEEWAP